MSEYEVAISRVKEILQNVNSTKSQDPIVSKALFSALSSVSQTARSAQESVLVANANLLVLEDVCSCRYLSLGKSLQNIITVIYSFAVSKAPGYVVRNVINSMVAICSNKASSNGSKECSAAVIGVVIEKRSFDCGSILNDVIQCLTKSVKSGDTTLRVAALISLSGLVRGAGPIIGDCHPEIFKVASKCVTDRNPEVRLQIADLISALARQSSGCTSVPSETLVASVLKGLEDENLLVQDAFARAYASIFCEQIRAYLDQQEKAKIGLARGSDSAQTQQKRRSTMGQMGQRIAKFNFTSSGKSKVVDDFEFRSVVTHILKSTVRSSNIQRNIHIAVLSYLVRECLDNLDQGDMEWLVGSIIGVLRDASISGLQYEEIVFFRTRLSGLLGNCISSYLPESRLLLYASVLTQFIANTEHKTEHELQVALGELCHVIRILGEAAVSILDEVQTAVTLQLRHSGFGVRSTAAYALVSFAEVVPGVAASLLRTSLAHARAQAMQLSVVEAVDLSASAAVDVGGDDVLTGESSSRRKSPKEIERLQRMYFFHGHTLVVSLFVKSESRLPTGLPKSLLLDIFDFGIELLRQEVLAVPAAVRNIMCSLVRAGSLIVSSCLNMGYQAARPRILPLLRTCHVIFTQANAGTVITMTSSGKQAASNCGGAGTGAGAGATQEDLLYELMSVEATLVCVSSLLWSCPESLEYEQECLALVVECLDMAFRAIKSKYQPKFRTHFRFRTLHVIVLECFAWLPPGSFPTTCQQMFVEALRVFRDCLSQSAECTCLADITAREFGSLVEAAGDYSAAAGPKSTLQAMEAPVNRDMMLLKLENYAVALQRKESEAFLATFGKLSSDDTRPINVRTQYLEGVDWLDPRAPCAQIDSRTVDAAIALIERSFALQTAEYQEKAVQLCMQGIAQLAKSSSSSLGMFSSDEEKRRKERKAFVTTKNVVACLAGVVQSFPFEHPAASSWNLSWGKGVLDSMLEILTHGNLDIRCAGAAALSRLAGGNTRSSLLESVFQNIVQSLSAAADKRGENLADNAGLLLTFAELWKNASNRQNTQKNILNTLLEYLRRVEFAAVFRAHGIFALCKVMEISLGDETIDNESVSLLSDKPEAHSLLEKVCHVAEINLVSISSSGDDTELLFFCLLRLMYITIPAALKIITELDQLSSKNSSKNSLTGSSDGGDGRTEHNATLRTDMDGILARLLRMWELIKGSSEKRCIQEQAMATLSRACSYAAFFEKVPASQVAALLTTTTEWCRDVSTLRYLVDCVHKLAKKNVVEVCEFGLDVLLYQLLNWSVGSVPAPSPITYSGLDLHCGTQMGLRFADEDMGALQREVEAVIEYIAIRFALPAQGEEATVTDVAALDRQAVPYLLFCRAVALAVRSEGGGDGDAGAAGQDGGEGGRDEDGDADEGHSGGGEAAVDVGGGKSQHGAAAIAALSAKHLPLTYQQFVIKHREAAVSKASALSSLCSYAKQVALRCAGSILAGFTSDRTHQAHSNIELARRLTRAALAGLGPAPSDEALAMVPVYAGLWLHDIVNLACATATHTINDKPLIGLQIESMCLLKTTTTLFINTPDPDHAHTGEDVGGPEKALAQFITQIVSAVRPCLSGSCSPELTLSAGEIICSLIQGGLLSDKVAVRRLAKLVIAFAEDKDLSMLASGQAGPSGGGGGGGGEATRDQEGSVGRLQVRARLLAEMSEEASISSHVTGASLIARLFLMTVPHSWASRDVEPTVRTTLVSMLQDHITAVSGVWYGILLDNVRLQQVRLENSASAGAARVPNRGMATGVASASAGGGEDTLASQSPAPSLSLVPPQAESAHVTAGVGSISLSCAWPLMSVPADPRRGGSTYAHTADVTQLIGDFDVALPTVFAALAQAKKSLTTASSSSSASSASSASSSSSALSSSPIEGDEDFTDFMLSIGLSSLQNYVMALKATSATASGGRIVRGDANLPDFDTTTKQRVALLLTGLANLPKNVGAMEREQEQDGQGPRQGPTQQWIALLSFLCTEILPILFCGAGRMAGGEGWREGMEVLVAVVDVLSDLSQSLPASPPAAAADDVDSPPNSASSSPASSLAAWLWTTGLMLLSGLAPHLFNTTTGGDISSISAVAHIHRAILTGILPTVNAVPKLQAPGDVGRTDQVGDGPLAGIIFSSARLGEAVALTSTALPHTDILCRVLSVMTFVAKLRAAVAPYWARVLTALLPVVNIPAATKAPVTMTAPQKAAITEFIGSKIAQLTSSSTSTAGTAGNSHIALVLNIIMADLVQWQRFFRGASLPAAGTAAVPLDAHAATIAETLLSAWRLLAEQQTNLAAVPYPIALSAIILQARSSLVFSKSVLQLILKLVQMEFSRLGPVIVETILPATLTALMASSTGSRSPDESIELLLVQLVFLAFNVVPEAGRGDFVGVILPPLCSLMSSQPVESSQTIQFAGKGLTHLARTHADVFREHVARLPEASRSVLQNVMRYVLQQSTALATPAAGGSGAAVGVGGPAGGVGGAGAGAGGTSSSLSFKKIDMSRYKASKEGSSS